MRSYRCRRFAPGCSKPFGCLDSSRTIPPPQSPACAPWCRASTAGHAFTAWRPRTPSLTRRCQAVRRKGRGLSVHHWAASRGCHRACGALCASSVARGGAWSDRTALGRAVCAMCARFVQRSVLPALNVTCGAPDGQQVRNRTRSGCGRSVPLAEELVPVIVRRATGKGPDDVLFTSEEGHRLINSNRRRILGWPSSCRGRRIHDLRHTAATFWLHTGVDAQTVQQ